MFSEDFKNTLAGELQGSSRWKIFITLFVTRLIAVAVVVLFVAFIVFWARPEKPTPDRARMGAAQNCAKNIRDSLRLHRGEIRSVVCLPFRGDSTDSVFDATRDVLSSTGALDVQGSSFCERFRRTVGASQKGVYNAERAARAARRRKADAALIGDVKQYESVDGKGVIVVEYRLIDANGKEVFADVYDSKIIDNTETRKEETNSDLNRLLETGASTSWINEFGIPCSLTLLIILGGPIILFRFLEKLTAKRSNAANAIALLGCLMVDAAGIWFFLRPSLETTFSILGVVILTVFAFLYNVKILSVAHARTAP